jgi:hypothetical protein
LVTKVEPNINSIEVHPQPSNNQYPVDGALVGIGSVWASTPTSVEAPYAYYYMQKGLSDKVESKLIIKI